MIKYEKTQWRVRIYLKLLICYRLQLWWAASPHRITRNCLEIVVLTLHQWQGVWSRKVPDQILVHVGPTQRRLYNHLRLRVTSHEPWSNRLLYDKSARFLGFHWQWIYCFGLQWCALLTYVIVCIATTLLNRMRVIVIPKDSFATVWSHSLVILR